MSAGVDKIKAWLVHTDYNNFIIVTEDGKSIAVTNHHKESLSDIKQRLNLDIINIKNNSISNNTYFEFARSWQYDGNNIEDLCKQFNDEAELSGMTVKCSVDPYYGSCIMRIFGNTYIPEEIPDWVNVITSDLDDSKVLNRRVKLGKNTYVLDTEAFCGSNIETIECNSMLAYMENAALYGCDYLKELILPKSLADFYFEAIYVSNLEKLSLYKPLGNFYALMYNSSSIINTIEFRTPNIAEFKLRHEPYFKIRYKHVIFNEKLKDVPIEVLTNIIYAKSIESIEFKVFPNERVDSEMDKIQKIKFSNTEITRAWALNLSDIGYILITEKFGNTIAPKTKDLRNIKQKLNLNILNIGLNNIGIDIEDEKAYFLDYWKFGDKDIRDLCKAFNYKAKLSDMNVECKVDTECGACVMVFYGDTYIPEEIPDWVNIIRAGNSNSRILNHKVKLGKTTYVIDSLAFRESNIETLECNDMLVCIGAYAFSDCDNLRELILPKSLLIIDGKLGYPLHLKKLSIYASSAGLYNAIDMYSVPEIVEFRTPNLSDLHIKYIDEIKYKRLVFNEKLRNISPDILLDHVNALYAEKIEFKAFSDEE